MCDSPFLLNCLLTIFLGIVSTGIVFVITILVFTRQRILVSCKIARGVNKSTFKTDGEVAWKFHIMNKSLFAEIYDLQVKLVGIQIVKNDDGTCTQHRKLIDSITGTWRLSRRLPDWILAKIRAKDKQYTIDFSYRPLTYENLDELAKEYDKFELSVMYTDSITGRIHVVIKEFENVIVEEGEFSNDGRLDYTSSEKIPEIAWKNHKIRMQKQKEKDNDKEA